MVGADGADVISANLFAYVVNPHGANRDAAIAYLEYAAAHRDARLRALLSPDTAQPSFFAYAQEDESFQALPEAWEVSAPALAVYRTDIAPQIDLMLSPLLVNQSSNDSSAFNGMMEAIQAYVQGKTTLDACVEELNSLK